VEAGHVVNRGTRRVVRALLPVHLYGHPCDLDPLLALARRYPMAVVEDSAEALGARYRGRAVGVDGLVGCLSFNGNKIITTSGGGMLVSDSPEFVARARYLATQAREPVPHYEHKTVGYNYRLSNLLAAVGRGQLQNLDQKASRRREINAFYRRRLKNHPGISFMPEIPGGRSTFWLTCLTIDPETAGVTNEQLRLLLEEHNIESRHLWKPMHLQPAFKGYPYRGTGVASKLFDVGLCLPSGSGLSNADLDRIAAIVQEALEKTNSLEPNIIVERA
jgi:dTDP-4-amino-4,6-dideoxygalactose transaminase